ncbi:hypothetical protein GF382_01125 [Candidatus Falkowbacteria bacterium]|nr:hypothetical protein [Candidatus Falkowbacteria bacterium]
MIKDSGSSKQKTEELMKKLRQEDTRRTGLEEDLKKARGEAVEKQAELEALLAKVSSTEKRSASKDKTIGELTIKIGFLEAELREAKKSTLKIKEKAPKDIPVQPKMKYWIPQEHREGGDNEHFYCVNRKFVDNGNDGYYYSELYLTKIFQNNQLGSFDEYISFLDKIPSHIKPFLPKTRGDFQRAYTLGSPIWNDIFEKEKAA